MSWSHEDAEKPTLAESVLSTLKQRRAALEAKGDQRQTSRAAQVTSKDWMPDYEGQPLSVDLTFEQVFEGEPLIPELGSLDSLGQHAAADAKYEDMFNSIFASPQPTESPFLVEAPAVTPDLKAEDSPADRPKAPKRKRRRRKARREPEVKEYVDKPTELDVLLGRGGLSNHFAGNKRYRDEVANMQSWYKSSHKDEKTDLSQQVVDYIHSYGGRFLKKDATVDKWFIVTNIVARKKASQALREHKTPEQRALEKLMGSKKEST